MDWFRSWHGAPTDTKWMVVAKRANVTPMMVSATFWALLDYASQQQERGSVAGFDVEAYALWAGCDEEEVLNILAAMRAKGIITDGETLAAWDKRQPKREDDSAERVRKHRNRQRMPVTVEAVTQCNADVTQGNAPEKIREEQSRLDSEQSRAEQTREEPDSLTHSPTGTPTAAQEKDATKAVARCLEDHGVALTQYLIDEYMGAVKDYGIHATLAGIQAAAEQGKQQKLKYVLACIRGKASGDSRTNGNHAPPKAIDISAMISPELAKAIGA